MKPVNIMIGAGLVAVIAAFVTVKLNLPRDHGLTKTETSITERVEKTNTLRCGYITYAPYLIKDANTGKLSGLFYDLTEKMGHLLNLKVEWSYETTFATYVEDMRTGRYDVFCGGLWPEANRSRFVSYTKPVNYVGLGVYVRRDDHRFDHNVEGLNNKAYRFTTMDAEMSDIVAKEDFPQAQSLSHGQNTDVTQLLLDVTTRKADAIIVDRIVVAEFSKTNPDMLKNLVDDRPIRLFGNTWGTLRGNDDLVSMMNTAIDEMMHTGFIDKAVSRYDFGMNNFYPVAPDYQIAK